MPTLFETFMLAVLQGITEFLPVSSSGHIVLAKRLAGLHTEGVTLEVVLHLGTLVAILVYYRETLAKLVADLLGGKRDAYAYLGLVVLGCLPAAVVGFLGRKQIGALFDDPKLTMVALMVTGLLLLSLVWRGKHRAVAPLNWWRVIVVGLGQMLALVPGVSRSGWTIGLARHVGVAPEDSARFSMLMFMPLVLGAAVLELRDAAAVGSFRMPLPHLGVGFLVSAAVGYCSLAVLVKTLAGGRFWAFGIYCLIAGGIGIVLLP